MLKNLRPDQIDERGSPTELRLAQNLEWYVRVAVWRWARVPSPSRLALGSPLPEAVRNRPTDLDSGFSNAEVFPSGFK
jgi:hypothetical protein